MQLMMKNLLLYILLVCHCINADIAGNDPVYPLKIIKRKIMIRRAKKIRRNGPRRKIKVRELILPWQSSKSPWQGKSTNSPSSRR